MKMDEKSKVVLVFCDSYEEELVYQKLKEGFALLGDVECLIDKKEKILLKPNLLKKAELDRAVITHPSIVGGVARILKEKGYEQMIMADSCGHGTTSKVIQGTGMETYLKRLGVRAVDFTEAVEVPYPEGIQAKKFMLSRELTESDCVISLCKMKTHALERITGAVKNSYGFIYGLYKAKGHTLYPNSDSFARMLVDLNACVKPRLYIMDGIVAMEGNGPGSGNPVPMNVILMSKDPVALDSVFARLIHLKPQMVPTNYHGEKMGLGVWREEKIEILTLNGVIGMKETVQLYGNSDFDVDRRSVRSGKWERIAKALKIFQKKPFIDAEKCIKCGICVNSCPVSGKAIDFKKGKNQPPIYDYKKCIRCFCCQEMCPQKAIQVK